MSREPDVKRLAFAITLLTFSLSLVSETHSLLREAGAQKRTVPSLTASMTSQERPPPPPPPPPANAGSAEPNTPKQGSGTDLGSSLKSLSPAQEIQRLSQGQIPCARHSLLLGIGTMAAVSAVGLVAGRCAWPAGGEPTKRKRVFVSPPKRSSRTESGPRAFSLPFFLFLQPFEAASTGALGRSCL